MHIVVTVTCFDYNNFSYLTTVKIMLNILNKREMKFIFHNDSYETDNKTEKMMIKLVRTEAF